jgi:hypothetical protein
VNVNSKSEPLAAPPPLSVYVIGIFS